MQTATDILKISWQGVQIEASGQFAIAALLVLAAAYVLRPPPR